EVEVALVEPGIEHTHNAGVVEALGGARLLGEALLEFRARRHVGVHDFDGDGPLEAHVGRPEDRTHAAVAELLLDAVVTKRAANERLIGHAGPSPGGLSRQTGNGTVTGIQTKSN